MLNPAFSQAVADRLPAPYVLPDDVVDAVLGGNADYATGPERRTQPVFEDELWRKLDRLGAPPASWGGLDVLDAACGTGFLAHHLLARARPASLTLADISQAELDEARRLVAGRAPERLEAVRCDLTKTPFDDGSFDVVVGNSFLHHFPSVPAVLAELRRILRPGGRLLVVHEPTPAAFALEPGKPLTVAAYAVKRRRLLEAMRHPGPGPVGPDPGDVWVFDKPDLERLLRDAGFADVEIAPWHLARPLLFGGLNLLLGPGKPALTPREERLAKGSIAFDAAVSRVLPAGAFGSLSLRGSKR